MKAAYNNRTSGFKEPSAGIDFDQDSVSEDELRLLRTRTEILRKLQAIFNGQNGGRRDSRSDEFSSAEALDSECPSADV